MDKLSPSTGRIPSRDRAKYLSVIMQELWLALGQIRGCTTTLIEECQRVDREVAHTFLKDIDKNVNLMDRLLAYGKLLASLDVNQETDIHYQTDLGPVMEPILEKFATDTKIGVASPKTLPSANVDAAHFDQIFRALAGIAIRYAAPGKGIDLKIKVNDSQIIIEIISKGAEPDADCLATMFDPLAHHQIGGDIYELESALDLYLAHELALIAGGNVWASALPGVGVNIYLALPLATASTVPVKAVSREPRVRTKVKEASKKKRDAFTILVADDEPAMSGILRRHLEDEGYKVIIASGGRQAVDLISSRRPDLVLLDMHMPDMTGLDVCTEVREFSTVPIIMVTGGPNQDVALALNSGIDDHLSKPVKKEELLARVNAYIRRDTIYKRPEGEEIFTSGDLTVDFARRMVTMQGKTVKLGRQEYKLLAYLAINAGHTVSRDQILENVWGTQNRGQYEYVWIYVKRVREKLGDDPSDPKYILNNPGLGYYLPVRV